jgi:hypothetical protein
LFLESRFYLIWALSPGPFLDEVFARNDYKIQQHFTHCHPHFRGHSPPRHTSDLDGPEVRISSHMNN